MITRRWREAAGISEDKRRYRILKDREAARRFDNGYDDDDDEEDEYDEDPVSVEDELQFLNEFDAANPSAKDRITRAISMQNRFSLPSLRRSNNDKSKSRRGQRQFTIKSIQKWWKERPVSQQSIAIIEPHHLRNQQHQNQQQDQKKSKFGTREQTSSETIGRVGAGTFYTNAGRPASSAQAPKNAE